MNMHALRHPVFAMLAAGLVLSAALPALASSNSYLKVQGQTQGLIMGPGTGPGREGGIEVFSAEHTVKTAIDPATGLSRGGRQHGVFTIRKSVDKSSPKLYIALVHNENLPEWELKFYAPDRTGVVVNQYTIKLINARITSIKLVQPNTKDTATANSPLQEEVSFAYQKITWIWTDGLITAQDDWASPTP